MGRNGKHANSLADPTSLKPFDPKGKQLFLGHPLGRIYNFRHGLTADWRRVFDLAPELDKAVK